MEFSKVCLTVWLCSLVLVYGRPLNDQELTPTLCWRLRGTNFKLCVEDENDVIMEKKIPVGILRQLFPFPLINGKDTNRPGSDFTFNPSHKLFSTKKDLSDETFIHKRPFDSISYNTGLGGFK